MLKNNILLFKKMKNKDKELVLWLVFDHRDLFSPRFITSLKNLFNPTRRSNTSHKTNSKTKQCLSDKIRNWDSWFEIRDSRWFEIRDSRWFEIRDSRWFEIRNPKSNFSFFFLFCHFYFFLGVIVWELKVI